ncbi:MAG TPA: hypothetical protein VHZ52_03055 [Acidobacteriaceae bacterium]|jgi:hypothetical protein|nr:hypothetical protein [Acidobacteriaceae bacterium]
MGREATCECRWANESASCKVLLETTELIVRGPIRHRVAIASLTQVKVQGEELIFRAGGDEVVLSLGEKLAQSWARKIASPPPTLAAKLGISEESHLLLLGEFESEELKSAISVAGSCEGKNANLILVRVKTAADLNFALDRYAAQPSQPPIWVIYPKGAGTPLPEREIRSTLRHEGFIDTKVASVSASLTALRFIKRA